MKIADEQQPVPPQQVAFALRGVGAVVAAHLALAVVEVGGAGFILAVLESLSELPVEGGDVHGVRGEIGVGVVRARTPQAGRGGVAREWVGLAGGLRAPVVFFGQGASAGPPRQAYPTPVKAGGHGGEDGVAFQAELVEVEGSGKQTVGQVGVGQNQMGGIHTLDRGHPHPLAEA